MNSISTQSVRGFGVMDLNELIIDERSGEVSR